MYVYVMNAVFLERERGGGRGEQIGKHGGAYGTAHIVFLVNKSASSRAKNLWGTAVMS